MDTAIIRQQLHNYLEIANDKKLNATCTMVEDEIKETLIEYSREFKDDLDNRLENYLKGGKTISPAQMNKRLMSLRKKRK